MPAAAVAAAADSFNNKFPSAKNKSSLSNIQETINTEKKQSTEHRPVDSVVVTEKVNPYLSHQHEAVAEDSRKK